MQTEEHVNFQFYAFNGDIISVIRLISDHLGKPYLAVISRYTRSYLAILLNLEMDQPFAIIAGVGKQCIMTGLCCTLTI